MGIPESFAQSQYAGAKLLKVTPCSKGWAPWLLCCVLCVPICHNPVPPHPTPPRLHLSSFPAHVTLPLE